MYVCDKILLKQSCHSRNLLFFKSYIYTLWIPYIYFSLSGQTTDNKPNILGYNFYMFVQMCFSHKNNMSMTKWPIKSSFCNIISFGTHPITFFIAPIDYKGERNELLLSSTVFSYSLSSSSRSTLLFCQLFRCVVENLVFDGRVAMSLFILLFLPLLLLQWQHGGVNYDSVTITTWCHSLMKIF